MCGAVTKNTLDGITDNRQNFLEGTTVFPACDNMITPSLVAVLTGWSLTCHLMISSSTHCRLLFIPWLGPVPLPTRLVNTIVYCSKACGKSGCTPLETFRGRSQENIMNSLLRAKAWRASLSGDSLASFGSWDFPRFQRLMDEAGYEDKTSVCTTFPAFISVVLRLSSGVFFTQICARKPFSLSEFWSTKMLKCSIALVPLVTPSWIVAQVTKTHKEFALGLMDGSYKLP